MPSAVFVVNTARVGGGLGARLEELAPRFSGEAIFGPAGFARWVGGRVGGRVGGQGGFGGFGARFEELAPGFSGVRENQRRFSNLGGWWGGGGRFEELEAYMTATLSDNSITVRASLMMAPLRAETVHCL